jgi:hypothetical protein
LNNNIFLDLTFRRLDRFRVLRWCSATAIAGALLVLAQAAVAQEFAIAATSAAPAQLSDGHRSAVLSLALSNPAAGGVPVVQWDSVGLRFESAAGVPLNATSTEALVASIEVYRDANASGAFESASDLLVAQTWHLPLAIDGGVNLAFTGSDPVTLQVGSGGSVHFFIVLTIASNASAASPNTLRVTHLATGSLASTARHAGTGALLTPAGATDFSTPVLTIALDSPPTTAGLLPIVIQQPAQPALVPLRPAFSDAQDSASDLTYTVTGNTNPGLLGFVGIDATTDVLMLEPQAAGQGEAQLTVQATDSVGKAVNTTLRLHVGPLASYADFAAAYFGAGGAGISGIADDPARSGVSNLLKYAFALHPLKNGDRAGLPALTRTGQARIFSHLRPKFAADLLYRYEKSSDLVNWTPAVAGEDYFSAAIDLGDGSQRVECLLLGNPERVFLRASVQLTSPPPAPSATAPSVATLAATATVTGSTPLAPPPPDTPLPIASSVVFPSEQILSGPLVLPSAVITADLNDDGWKDVVSISEGDDRVSWYRNDAGTLSPRIEVPGETRSGSGLVAADFTGDGLPDIASASAIDNKIAWYQNLGGSSIGSQQVISTAAQYALSVAAADIDHDGLIDIVSGSGAGPGAKLAWYKNHGAPSYFIPGQENLIVSPGASAAVTSGNLPFSIAAENIDGDATGYADIAIASYNDSTVTFLRGNGTSTFTRQVLSTSEGGAIELALGDIDGDGLKDIVSISAYGIVALGQTGGRIVWFKNHGAAPFGPPTVIAAEVLGLSGVTIADLNNDGKLDVVASTVRPAVGGATTGRLFWFRNLGSGSFGDPLTNGQLISDSGFEGKSVATADFDHNGLLDAVVTWQSSNKNSVYLNLGGQCSLAATDTAPASIYESGRDDVLRVAVTNHGSAGQDDARLATVGLLFEKAAGVAMTTAEANQLIESLHFHADTDGSGTFDPAADRRVATLFHLSLTGGKTSLSLLGAPPADLRTPPGATRYFFAVPQLTAHAAAQTPSAFRITHLLSGAGASTLRAAYSGDALVLAGAPADVASNLVAAQSNAAPTTSGLANLSVFDPTATSYVQLPLYFADAESGPALLDYAIVQVTNPALFRFIGLEPGSHRLSLKYRPGASGAATIGVRATDPLGKSVTASFQVTVGYTFADWTAQYPPPGTAAWPADPASIYAFGLNPLIPGDLGNAPRMWRQGAVKGLRHLRQRWSTDLGYRYLVSSDLVNWTPAIPGVHIYEFRHPLGSGLDQSDVVLLVDWPRAFLRPQAQLP